MKHTILIAGGTGTLGRQVVGLLGGVNDVRVRVLTRNPHRARDLFPEGVDIIEGDVRSPSEVAKAVAGCHSVVSLVHGFVGEGKPSPESIDRDGNRVLIAAAVAASSIRHFVLLSVCGASADHPMSLHRAKLAAEESLRETAHESDLAFTIVRAAPFLETWIGVIGGGTDAKRAVVFGPGTNPINFVSVRDVAAVVAMCLRDDGVLRNETVDVGGPETLGFLTFAEQLGKPIKQIPLPVLRAMSFLARPFSPVFARLAAAAVVMNTTDMTLKDCGLAVVRDRYPRIPVTTLAQLLSA